MVDLNKTCADCGIRLGDHRIYYTAEGIDFSRKIQCPFISGPVISWDQALGNLEAAETIETGGLL